MTFTAPLSFRGKKKAFECRPCRHSFISFLLHPSQSKLGGETDVKSPFLSPLRTKTTKKGEKSILRCVNEPDRRWKRRVRVIVTHGLSSSHSENWWNKACFSFCSFAYRFSLDEIWCKCIVEQSKQQLETNKWQLGNGLVEPLGLRY